MFQSVLQGKLAQQQDGKKPVKCNVWPETD